MVRSNAVSGSSGPTFLLSVARLGFYYNTRQVGGQGAQFTELWYLRLATPIAERLTVILSKDRIKSAIQLTPS